MSILIVEDEVAIAESLTYLLEREPYVVRHAPTLARARALLEGVTLVILDLGLPDGNGLELLSELRRRPDGGPPVLVLTSRGDEVDRIVGLEVGADDYVVKPFSPREVVARVKAVLRRGGQSQAPNDAAEQLVSGPLVMDHARRTASWAERRLDLTRLEYDLLALLAANDGREFTRTQLLDRVWGNDAVVGDRTVDVHVKTLRAKLAVPEAIETVRGLGYRWRRDQ